MAEKTERELPSEAVGARYCDSRWAHKPHLWFTAKGVPKGCPGATSAEKPNKD